MNAPPVSPRHHRRSRPAPMAEMAATLVALANALYDQRCHGLGVESFPQEPAGNPGAARGLRSHRAGC
jgi:hypothetical protein